MIEYLIQQGADVNARATWGWYTPLHVACKYGYEDVAKCLLKHGAKWHIRDKYRATPLRWAIRSGHSLLGRTLDEVRVVVVVLLSLLQ